jgi:hypothetical protein
LSKLTLRTILLLSAILLGSATLVRAQGISISPYVGLGSARDPVGTDTADGCTSGQIFDGLICQSGPSVGGLFGELGVDFMFKKHLGVNGEYALHLSQSPYLPSDGLNMRPSFYDINALWQPFSSQRLVPFLEGGVGGAKVNLYFNAANSTIGLTTPPSLPTGMSPTYFQLHAAFGMKFYVRGHLFVRPEFGLHYTPRLNHQFARNLVIEYIISAGYTFGGH